MSTEIDAESVAWRVADMASSIPAYLSSTHRSPNKHNPSARQLPSWSRRARLFSSLTRVRRHEHEHEAAPISSPTLLGELLDQYQFGSINCHDDGRGTAHKSPLCLLVLALTESSTTCGRALTSRGKYDTLELQVDTHFSSW